jgi:hypothetical protein
MRSQGALSVPVLTTPHVVSFSPESYWKGESHRISDRVGGVARLMEEMEAAGVEQVIAVCADAERAVPHRLVQPAASLETRMAEQYAALETAGMRDAFAAHAERFGGVFIIQPGYNPYWAVRLRGRLRRSLGPASCRCRSSSIEATRTPTSSSSSRLSVGQSRVISGASAWSFFRD